MKWDLNRNLKKVKNLLKIIIITNYKKDLRKWKMHINKKKNKRNWKENKRKNKKEKGNYLWNMMKRRGVGRGLKRNWSIMTLNCIYRGRSWKWILLKIILCFWKNRRWNRKKFCRNWRRKAMRKRLIRSTISGRNKSKSTIIGEELWIFWVKCSLKLKIFRHNRDKWYLILLFWDLLFPIICCIWITWREAKRKWMKITANFKLSNWKKNHKKNNNNKVRNLNIVLIQGNWTKIRCFSRNSPRILSLKLLVWAI